MIRWATASYPFLQQSVAEEKPVQFSDLIFIFLRLHEDKYHMTENLRALYSDAIHTVIIDHPTRGAAETAYLAKQFLPLDEDVIISDSDHHFDGRPLWEAIQRKDAKTIGILPVIRPPDIRPTWSYVVMKKDTRYVADIREKDRQLAEKGCPGVLGAYYFLRAKDFIDEMERIMHEDDRVGEEGKKEYYVSQLYRRFLTRGEQIEVAPLTKGWVLGTPEQLNYFLHQYSGATPWSLYK